ncbi:hypothetical protein HMPREF8577_1185 [Streptococcus parasanguinis ATCC 903]|jgi:hypothetical protein|nr:hypothetical protein HMPREF8577_1185 [Streptococcus parasanguinis ATCC 903]
MSTRKVKKSFNLLHFIWDFAGLQKSAKSFFKTYPCREWNHFSGKLKFDVQRIFFLLSDVQKGKFLIE